MGDLSEESGSWLDDVSIILFMIPIPIPRYLINSEIRNGYRSD